jgi:hypothetical protein
VQRPQTVRPARRPYVDEVLQAIGANTDASGRSTSRIIG